jgi:hypothetical protein
MKLVLLLSRLAALLDKELRILSNTGRLIRLHAVGGSPT